MDSQHIIKVLNEFNEKKEGKVGLLSSILLESKMIFDLDRKRNEESSYLLNPLNYFSIPEPLNSKMLADLLNKNGLHGQGTLFLRLFLEKLGFVYDEKDNWIIRSEAERLDISLVCNNPYRVIILENKVNGAIDQLNQLYRYYELKIKRHYKVGEDSSNRNFRIVYLTRTKQKIKAEHALESYNGMDTVPSDLVVDWTFDEHIAGIFSEAKGNSKMKENERLRTYLDFFIEYSTKQ